MDEITRGQRRFDIGTAVIDANGERIGYVTAIHDRWLEATPDPSIDVAYQVPRSAVVDDGAEAVVLSLDRDELRLLPAGSVDRTPARGEAPLGAGGGTTEGAGEGDAYAGGRFDD